MIDDIYFTIVKISNLSVIDHFLTWLLSLQLRADALQDEEQIKDDKIGDDKSESKRAIMQLTRFGWIDVLEARSKSSDEPVKPCIYTTKFR